MNKKELMDYAKKFGHVPEDMTERFLYIMELLKLKKKDIDSINDSLKAMIRAPWKTLDFVIYFIPKATPRARRGMSGVFYVRNASANSDFFKQFLDSCEQDLGIITTPCKMHIDIYMPMPSGMTRLEKVRAELKRIWAISKPDWDNAGKTYSDMIQKHLLLDDSLVAIGSVGKYYSFKPRIEIHLEYMEHYDSMYNKRKVEGWKTYQDMIDQIEEKDAIV